MSTPQLRNLKRAAARAADAREGLEAAIRAAHADGESLRKIADIAGVSHEQVRRVVRAE